MRSKFKWIFTLLVVLTMQLSFAQEKTVTGVVSDATGPLPGANVLIQGTTRGVQTDFDGKYSIKAKTGEVLIFSFIGMAESRATVGASNSINIKLQDSSVKLEEVLITGAMGIKKRKDAQTSTQQVVKAKELTQASSPNVIQALAGKVSGLQINTASNGANPNTKIVLRGNRSLTGSNQALIVIDNAISSASILALLPPEVIESVNVIKGQQGSALYGEQGSNGVIVVTTKKGTQNSKMTVSLTSSVDFQTVSFLPERQTKYGQGWAYGYDFKFPTATDPRNNSVQFSPYENGAWGPAFNNPAFSGTIVPVGLPQADGRFIIREWKSLGSDNIKDFFRTGTILQNGITINGGNEDGYSLLSVNRQTTDFVVQGDGLKRNSFLFKGGKKMGNFTVDANINYINQSVTQTDSDLFDDLLQTATNVPIAEFKNSGHQGNYSVYARNPYQVIKQVRNDDGSDVFNGIAALNYQFNKNISVNYTSNVQLRYTQSTSHDDGFDNLGIDYDFSPYSDFGDTASSYEALGGTPQTSSYFVSQSFGRKFYGDLIFNFNYDLTEDLNLKFNVGNNMQDNFTRVSTQGGTNLDTPGYYHVNNVLSPSNPSTLANGITRRRSISGFGNLDLDYKGYLFLNATARYDKSSTVADGVFYPSVGVSFVPTRAFENLKGDVLNYVKLSASFTKLGNTTSVNPYATNATGVSAAGFPFGDLVGFGFNQAPTSANIKPEFYTTKEAGVNLGFFGDRVTLDGTYYITDTSDLITRATASTPSGFVNSLQNVGDLQNKGYEIDLGLNPFRNANGFNWNIKANYSSYKTVVKALSNGVNSVNLQSNTFIGVFAEVGEEFPLIKGTAYERDPQGHIIVNSNGVPLKTTDFKKLGKSTPDYIIGFSNTFSYKGLSLTAVADYRAGHSIYSEAYATMAFAGYTLESASQPRETGYIVPNSVQQTTPGVFTTNATPTFNTTYGGGTYRGALDYFSGQYNRTGEAMLLDASAVKIKELSLSYDLPSKLLKNTGLTSFKFGVNARDPFIFFINNGNGIKNQGYTDPEASNTTGNGLGISNVGQYPTTKTYGASINLTF
ncbi:TonB-linked SusC/RagA family outer membrane protein [Flavobacterium sp. CG_23.5]|uniref:SusC/RagA family TonB-linked outer membrane protein n=1 Tax=Flavobacterium sp. CG_23.5 TaxID=2760708 RepID=UPI001AE5BEFA|nr:SusC/RagA family TonB-linked outer membrane protein [Flavobacterium sp. CG_23.5]MBP2283184.1 TonB-linked SusC/RagA family outer membrane protein [Flavobacterium sp. CG_23.5]